ncbi:alpha/beta fold hydrolase [Actinotalea sp. Marseille-Q4924]|uniref:alpha/beta fold hydrolase n=1 Tax=Actinotalea sp. Marseille-Q4924 TaxID=2866571 RepID=UPI001CE3DC5A|nr:alpha/beta hydrolase [Actinotalea sp. Marseille-Q4924]
MSLRTLSLAGHAVACFELGAGGTGDRGASGAADAVVLVHGIGVSSRYFGPLERDLSRSVRVVAPDLPGFGRSRIPDEPALTVVEHAEVLAALIEELGLDRPVVVGHSMGAQFVTELAVRRPELVGAVVLLGPVVDPAAPSIVRQGLRLAVDFVREPPRGALLQLREYLRTGVRWYLETARHMVSYRIEERLPLVTAPVTVVRGGRDPVAPTAFVRALAASARDGSAEEIPGGAHVVQWSRPDAVRAVIERMRERAVPC